MDIRPFHALRPRPDLAARIASPPYDVLDEGEARRMAQGRPCSFLHVNRPEIDLPEGTDAHDGRVYERAAANLRRFREEGWLVREAEPSLYVYRQQAGGHAQRGLVGPCSVADYERGVVRRHEHTRPAPEADRARHIDAVNAQVGPVLAAFRDRADVAALLDADAAGEPLYDFTADDGVRHTVWTAADPGAYAAAFASVPAAYIADGHHRAAGARRVALQRRDRPGGAGAAEGFLAVLFPAGDLRILAYNRCVRDLAGLTPEAFLARLRGQGFEVEPGAPERPGGPGRAAFRLAGRWFGLRWTVPPGSDPVDALDVSVLQDRLLGPVLGIGDPRKDERLSFVGGIRGTQELARRVDGGRDAVAFSLHPTSLDQLMAVADAGRTMPPKSTWFEPKLRSGLLVHALDG